MPQEVLPFQYQEERSTTGMTALAGLAPFLDLGHVAGWCRGIERHVNLRKRGQGWSDSQMINSLVLLNLAGGEAVDDLRLLEKDEGVLPGVKEGRDLPDGLQGAACPGEKVA